MMLRRKRSRAMPKDHYFSNAAAVASEKMRSFPFCSLPSLFVSLTAKGKGLWVSPDLMRSPTSPLDHKHCFSFPCPKSPERSWDFSRVGLSLVNSLSSESKNILLGPQIRTINTPGSKSAPLDEHAKSLAKDYGVSSPLRPSSLFSQLGSLEKMESFCPTDHKSQPKSDDSKNQILGSVPLLSGSIDSIHDCIDSLSATEMELSEDYTCIISHGPNPKTIHIFGDCILEPDNNGDFTSSLPSNGFLSFCNYKKKEAGKDIYM